MNSVMSGLVTFGSQRRPRRVRGLEESRFTEILLIAISTLMQGLTPSEDRNGAEDTLNPRICLCVNTCIESGTSAGTRPALRPALQIAVLHVFISVLLSGPANLGVGKAGCLADPIQ